MRLLRKHTSEPKWMHIWLVLWAPLEQQEVEVAVLFLTMKSEVIGLILMIASYETFCYMVFFIICACPALGQENKNNGMEIGKTIFNHKELVSFVKERFESVSFSKAEKTEVEHPLMLLNFNRQPKNIGQAFSLFSVKVASIYVYETNEPKYCTFLILELLPKDLEKIVQNLGLPENVTRDEYDEGDYDFLYWRYSGFEVFLNRSHSGDSRKNMYVMQVLNMPYRDIMDFSRIE